jgi:hypothetical protein
MNRTLFALVGFVEGRRPWSEWTAWLQANKRTLKPLLVPGELIPLHFRPNLALPRILTRLNVPFAVSDTFRKASRKQRRQDKPSRIKRVSHPMLGHLYWKDAYDAYCARLKLSDSVTISLLAIPDYSTTEDALLAASAAVTNLRRREPRIRRFATAHLRPIHNQAWNDGPPTSAALFLTTLRPSALHVYADGKASLYYGDGGLFFGHAVVVSIAPSGVPLDAYLAG